MPKDGEPLRYVVNEFEPVFDAADFSLRCWGGHSVETEAAGVHGRIRRLAFGCRRHLLSQRFELRMQGHGFLRCPGSGLIG